VEKVNLKLSHAGLIRALLAGFGLSPEEQGRVFDQILDGDVAVLARLRDQTPELVRLLTPLLDLKGESSGFLKNLKAAFNRNLPGFTPALDSFIAVTDLLTAMGQKYEIDIGSGRGFEYYTGVIFQLYDGDVKIGGGGRYDALIPLLGGENTPASGFALYLEPLMGLMKAPRPASSQPVLIIPAGDSPKLLKTAFQAVKRLHVAGFATVLGTDAKESGSVKWRLEILGRAPRYVLSGQSGKKKYQSGSIADVLRFLRGQNDA